MPQDDPATHRKSLEILTNGHVGLSQSLDVLVGVSVGFSSALLHDLRQPVSAILFNALAARRLVLKDEPSGRTIIEESLKDIISEVDRLKTLLQGFGTYLGLGGEDVPGLDVNQTVMGALGLLAGESVRRQMRLSTDLASALPVLQVSASQLTRAIIALALDLFQALEKAPTEQRHICVSTQLSEGHVKIGFQARFLPLLEGKSPSPPLQLQAWSGRTFVSQEPPEKITWGIELPTSPNADS